MRHLSILHVWPILSCLLMAVPAAAVWIPGGPQGGKATAADCYGGVEVVNVSGDDVSLNKHGVPTIGCMNGTACDHGAAYDDSCTFRVALCAAQRNVDGCTAPTSLQSFRATGKVKGLKKSKGRLTFEPGLLAEGCGEFGDLPGAIRHMLRGAMCQRQVDLPGAPGLLQPDPGPELRAQPGL